MGETPNRYGAHSSEQEQWVLNGELHSGTPATQRQGAAPAFSQSESAAGQMPRPDGASGENNTGFGGANGSSADFGSESSKSPSFSQPQRKYPVPPGYGGNDSWRGSSGMPRSGRPGDMGPGSFSGLGDNPDTPPKTPKSRAVPITGSADCFCHDASGLWSASRFQDGDPPRGQLYHPNCGLPGNFTAGCGSF